MIVKNQVVRFLPYNLIFIVGNKEAGKMTARVFYVSTCHVAQDKKLFYTISEVLTNLLANHRDYPVLFPVTTTSFSADSSLAA